MITGFRWHNGGAQKPSTTSCPTCRASARRWPTASRCRHWRAARDSCASAAWTTTDRPRVFLLSTTHGAETHALAAAIATMQIYDREPVIEHLYRAGRAVWRSGCRRGHRRRGLERPRQDVGQTVLPALCDARPGRPALAGVPDAVPAGDDPARHSDALAGGQLFAHGGRHRCRPWRRSTARWRSTHGRLPKASSIISSGGRRELVYRRYNRPAEFPA